MADVGAAQAQDDGLPPQHRLLVSSHGLTLATIPHTFCRLIAPPAGYGLGGCADGFPRPEPSVPAHGSDRLLLVTGVRVDEITARVASLDGRSNTLLPIAPGDASGRSFTAVLPPGPPLPLLLVSIFYSNVRGAGGATESGDAFFSFGLAEHRHARARPARVTARATARCGRPRGERRSCRLYQRGRIEPPGGAAADCHGGQMLVRVIARRRSVLGAQARTSADCRYRLRGRRFSLGRRAKRVLVRTRFLGSSSLSASRAHSVRLALRIR
ncbi:MAG: hypothetical protein LC790_18645 [Actinobacteria bacterium]|nr:hypothetical protein [Actinomycetota bacterium]